MWIMISERNSVSFGQVKTFVEMQFLDCVLWIGFHFVTVVHQILETLVTNVLRRHHIPPICGSVSQWRTGKLWVPFHTAVLSMWTNNTAGKHTFHVVITNPTG